MPKLPSDYRFLDLSDYGRPIARIIANALKDTPVTPIGVTVLFVISGLIGITCIILDYPWFAAFFLILKSILDAADGELARIKETPSYTGRYLDSVSDILLNLIILLAIGYVAETHLALTLLAFFCIQLQGTLYNYYYVILRARLGGDQTSRIFEIDTPKALPGESQKSVDFLFRMYTFLYGTFDKIIYAIDPKAPEGARLPNWLMTAVSIFGLGFQLLLIAVLLVLDQIEIIIPVFIIATFFVFLFIIIRRVLNR